MQKKNKINVVSLSLDYQQSLFFLGPSRKTPATRTWPRSWLKERDGRGTKKEKTGCRPRFSCLARACTPLTKSEEKERLLAVYIVFIVTIYSFLESTQVVELPRDVFASLTKVTYLWVLYVLLQNYLFNIAYLTLPYLYIFKIITFIQQGNFHFSVHPYCLNPSNAILVSWACCFL